MQIVVVNSRVFEDRREHRPCGKEALLELAPLHHCSGGGEGWGGGDEGVGGEGGGGEEDGRERGEFYRGDGGGDSSSSTFTSSSSSWAWA